MGGLYRKIKFTFKRMFRLLNVKNASHYVGIDQIKFHKSSGWNFGQFDKEKYTECGFKVDDTNYVDCNYSVRLGRLTFTSTILKNTELLVSCSGQILNQK